MSQTKVEAPFVEGGGGTGFKNLIINGDMQINQRGTTASMTSDTYGGPDRFSYNIVDNGTWTVSQETDVPSGQGFHKSLKLDCTSADASVAASSVFRFQQQIETQFLARVMHGTSDAKQMVLSFWIKWDNSIGGNFAVDILNLNNSNNRTVSKLFSYTADSGWQKYVWNIPADTGGNALTNDNTSAYYLQIFLSGGSNVTSGTMNTTWATRVNANRAAGQTIQSASSTSNNVYITGIQLEVSDSGASEFEFLPHDVQLQRCQRYFYLHTDPLSSDNEPVCMGTYYSSSQVNGIIHFPVTMRTSPSLICTDASTHFRIYRNGTGDTTDNWSAGNITKNAAEIYNNSDVSGTAGHGCTISTDDAAASISYNAEL